MCQLGSPNPLDRLTEATVAAARSALGDLLGADPAGVVLGRSMTQLTMDLARTLAEQQDGGGDRATRSSSPASTTTPTCVPG